MDRIQVYFIQPPGTNGCSLQEAPSWSLSLKLADLIVMAGAACLFVFFFFCGIMFIRDMLRHR